MEDDDTFVLPSVSSFLTWTNGVRCISFTLWIVSIHYFGPVMFVIGLILTIFRNLGVRDHAFHSAYSIFNKGCRHLLGDVGVEELQPGIVVRGNSEREVVTLGQTIQTDGIRSRDANKRCPCGSLKKYKKCCGLARLQ